MRVNNVVTKMKAGEMAYGCGFSFASPTLIEIAGRAGFDFVSFDSEHGPFTVDMLDDLCRFADMAGMTPMARVPDIEHPTILRFLDRGIMGITGPHIVNGDRARQLADACRYVPRGHRSFGSGRGAYFGDFPSGVDYMRHTNDNILVIAQLEDIEVSGQHRRHPIGGGHRPVRVRRAGHSAVDGLAGTAEPPGCAAVRGDRAGRGSRSGQADGGRCNDIHARRPRISGGGTGVYRGTGLACGAFV